MLIAFMRIDIKPKHRRSDLDTGKVIRVLNLKGQYLHTRNVTVKFTNSLCFQFFVKKNFYEVLDNLIVYVNNLYYTFNKFKKTKVRCLESVKINNILLQGRLERIDLQRITSHCNIRCTFVSVGSEPGVIVRNKEEIPSNFNFLDIHLFEDNSKLRVYYHKRITVIVNCIEQVQEYKDLVDYLNQKKKK